MPKLPSHMWHYMAVLLRLGALVGPPNLVAVGAKG